MKFLIFLLSVFFLFPAVAFAGNTVANSGATAVLSAPINSNFSQTFQASEQKREFPNTPGLVSPGLPTMFSNPERTVEFFAFGKMMILKQEWTRKDVNSFLKSSDKSGIHTDLRLIKRGLNPSQKLKLITKPPKDFEYIGSIIESSSRKGMDSEGVLVLAQDTAMKAGGNLLLLATEGSRAYLDLNVFGISLGYVHADMGGQGGGGAGVAGIGWATSTPSYRHKPFARFIILRVKAEEYMAISQKK